VRNTVLARLRWPRTLVFSAAAAFLAACAARLMFGVFMFYDDEGYVLLSLRNFTEHGGLYREIFSQYGPFPFVVHWVLHLCGLPPTHAGGRIVTLVVWVFVALAFAALAGRAARSTTAALATLCGTFAILFVMTSEPSHPGGLIVALVAIAAAGGWLLLRTGRFAFWGALAGATIAALALTKINVGLFAAFSALAWLGLHWDLSRGRPFAIIAVVAVCAALPPTLMRALLAEEWVAILARVWVTSALAVMVVLARKGSPCTNAKPLTTALLAGAIVTGAVVTVPLLRGSGIGDLVDGVLLGPLRNAVRYSNAYGWWPGIDWAAAASLAGATAATFAPPRWRETVDIIVAVLRIAAAAAVAASLAWPPVFMGALKVYGYILPCLWLFAWPLQGDEAGAVRARTWLVLLLLGQCLHVYPVAGSQVAWACVLAVPVAAVGATEAARWLGRRWGPATRRATGVVLATGFLTAAAVAGHGLYAEARWREDRPLVGLPGCGPLSQSADTASLLRVLTLNAVAHAEVLFSEPGMFSFNLWSGVPTPNGSNVTHWFSLLDHSRQRQIIRRLTESPRAAVIIDQGHIAFLRSRGLAPAGPLHDFITREFEPAFRAGPFEFRVRKGRSVRPFLLADLLVNASPEYQAGRKHMLRVPLLLPSDQSWIAAELPISGGKTLRLDVSNSKIETISLSPRGDPTGSPVRGTWPARIDGPKLLTIFFGLPEGSLAPREATVIFRGEDGGEVGLARLAP
jgi:hypothetical protein